jgi:hypothetical protein
LAAINLLPSAVERRMDADGLGIGAAGRQEIPVFVETRT